MTLWTRPKYKLFKIVPVADYEARKELLKPNEKHFEDFMRKFIDLIDEYNIEIAQRLYATDPPHSPPQIIILQDIREHDITKHTCLKVGAGFTADVLKQVFTFHLGGKQ